MADTATAQASNAAPKFDLNTMSNDDILGPEPKFDLTKQTNEDILGPEPSTWQTVKNAVPYFLGGGNVSGDVARDQFYRGTAVGRILDAFGQGAKDNWGTEPVGMSEDARKWMSDTGLITNDKESVWHQPIKAFNEAFFRAGATAWDMASRIPAAAVGGIGGGVGQTAQEFSGTREGRILGAFGRAAGEAFDTSGLDPESEKSLREYGLIKSDNDSALLNPKVLSEAAIRAGETVGKAILSTPGAVISGTAAAAGQEAREVGAEMLAAHPEKAASIKNTVNTVAEETEKTINLAGLALPDAMHVVHPSEAPLPKALQDAHDLNVIGPEGEAGWKGSPVAAPEAAEEVKGQTPEQQAAIADTKEATQAAETDKSAPQAPAQAPSIDDVARKIDPGTMDQWQSLNTRRDTYRQWISDLSEQQLAKAAENSPFADTIRNLTDQIAETQAKMEDTTPRLAKKYQARIDDFQSQLEDAQTQHDDYMQNAVADSGDVARVRQALMKTDYAMRDMAPQISDLYRQAQAQMGGEEAPVAPVAEQPQAAPEQPPVGAEQPAQAPAPQEPAKIAPVPAEAVPDAGEPSNVVGKETLGGASKETLGLPDQRAQIEKDVVDKLTKAGRPADEANAAAALISARYETRAERFGGSKGNALDLYNAEAPTVRRAGRAATPVMENEFAQSAFHGSPHEFDKFSTEHIGKGEGAQAFGWGLYFTNKKGIAEFYRDKLTEGNATFEMKDGEKLSRDELETRLTNVALKVADDRQVAEAAATNAVEALIYGDSFPGMRKWVAEQGDKDQKMWNAVLDAAEGIKAQKAKGRLFHVDLPEDAEMLDWEKPLSEQPDAVKKAIGLDKLPKRPTDAEVDAMYERAKASGVNAMDTAEYKDIERRIDNYRSEGWKALGIEPPAGSHVFTNPESITGEEYYRALSDAAGKNDQAASLRLREMGIPGLKYPAGTIAGSSKAGAHNYVVFDDNRVNVRSYEQSKRGTITFKPGQKPLIKLFADADASTFMHETGHAWLEELMSDAKEEGVHESVVKDAQTVRDWLGNDGGDLTRAQHEKFAKSFEQYLFTGQAPMPRLAEVFRQFRDWLSTIYNAVTGRGIKVSDDIRDVFDRLIAVNPERQPLLTNEPFGKTIADLHEMDAEHAPAEVARDTGHNVEGEMTATGEARPPLGEDVSEYSGTGRGLGEGTENSASPEGTREEAGNNGRGGEGNTPASPEVGSGTGEAKAESTGAREGAGAANRERDEGEVLTLPKKSGPVTEIPTSAHQQFEPERKPEQFFDKAGNIRLENLNRPEDIKSVLRTVADQNNGFEEARGGVKSLVDQQATADALGLTPQDFSPNRPAGVSESTWLRAVKDLTLRSATDVRDLMVKARDSGEDADAAALGKALARHTMIQAEFSRVKAESGRALAANRWDDAKAMVEGVGRMAEEATGMTLNQLKQMAQDGAALETPAQISKFVNDVQKPGLRDKIQYVALNGLISGPTTHMTYEIANMMSVIEESLVERPIAAAFGTARDLIKGEPTQGRVYWNEVVPVIYGAFKGGRDGVRAAIDAWRSNITSRLPGEESVPGFDKNMGAHREPPIGGAIGTAIGVPGRVITAMHSFNRNVFYAMNIQSMAVRAAKDLGLEGDALARKVADLTTSPTDDMMAKSIDYANAMAYMKKPEYGSAMYYIQKFSNANLATKLMLPFTQVAANIIDRAYVERTPIGLLKGRIRDDLMGRNGPAAADFARARMTAGTLIGGALTGLAMQGLATGSGPTNPSERQLWLVDHQPYSIRIGDTWVPYKRLGHLGMLMGLGANLAETIHTYNDKDAEHAVVQLAHGIASNVVDESWMAGVSNVLKMIDDPERAKGYAFSTASELVPYSAALRQTANALDPFSRDARGFEAEAQNMVPFWRQGLPPRRNVWGEPIPSPQSAPYALAASPFQSMIHDDPTTAEMQRIEVYPARAGRKIRGVELDPQQYDDYARVSGRLMKSRLDQITQSPGWAQMPDGIKAQVAKKIIDSSREAARSVLMMQNPDIIEQAVAAKRQALH